MLDPHADIGALTPNVEWSVSFILALLFLAIYSHRSFFINQRSVSKCQCLHEDLA